MRRALMETVIVGLTTNQQFLLQVLDHPLFIDGIYNTHFIQNHVPAEKRLAFAKAPLPDLLRDEVALACTAFVWEVNQQSQTFLRNVTPGFQNVFYKPAQKKFSIDDQEVTVEYSIQKKTHKQTLADNNVTFSAAVNGTSRTLLVERTNPNGQIDITRNSRSGQLFANVRITVDGRRSGFSILSVTTNQGEDLYCHSHALGRTLRVKTIPLIRVKAVESDGMLGNVVRAAMTGKIVQVLVSAGQEVKRGDTLLIMESMKMETKILSPKDGKISEVLAKAGVVFDEGSGLVAFVPPPKK
jgi:3-methylcrotonyl-CoA carboxylase alpha subunit